MNMDWQHQKWGKRFCAGVRWLMLLLNLAAVCGSVYYAIQPTAYMFENRYGWLVLLALLGNVGLAGMQKPRKRIGTGYLLVHSISMLLIPIVNTLASANVQNQTSQSPWIPLLYSALFGYGMLMAVLQIRQAALQPQERGEAAAVRIRKTVRRQAALYLLGLIVAFGVFLAYNLLVKSTSSMVEVFIPEYAVFWGLLILGVAVLFAERCQSADKRYIPRAVVAVGIVVCAVCMLPLARVPKMISEADAAYRQAFGTAYLEDPAVQDAYGFKQTPFSLQDYFFGSRGLAYQAEENVLYYTGTTGADTGLQLYFDVYSPAADGMELPGKNAAVIRIHGGSWSMGDKGASNYSQENKHLASQGYVVFDIQYGLNDQHPSFASAAVPDYVKGDFRIDDMLRHIGIFTTYLADHAAQYHVNLETVFITGASAGGQLATAAALGITSGRYTGVLDSRLKIKGLIPYYPANGLSPKVDVQGTPALVDPVALVDANSPPCLIFHGTHDGIVDPQLALAMQSAYREQGEAPCAVLWMDFAGHGSDFYVAGYYNQVFTYYLERFLLQFQ